MSKTQLNNVQNNPIDPIMKRPMKPHEYYNLHVRQEGQPVITEAEFNAGLHKEAAFVEGLDKIEADFNKAMEILTKKYR
jgi:hypothetical protein